MNFLRYDTKVQVTTTKNRVDFINIRIFCVSKTIIKKKKKRDTQNGRKYLQITFLIRELDLEYTKNSYNSIIKRK